MTLLIPGVNDLSFTKTGSPGRFKKTLNKSLLSIPSISSNNWQYQNNSIIYGYIRQCTKYMIDAGCNYDYLQILRSITYFRLIKDSSKISFKDIKERTKPITIIEKKNAYQYLLDFHPFKTRYCWMKSALQEQDTFIIIYAQLSCGESRCYHRETKIQEI